MSTPADRTNTLELLWLTIKGANVINEGSRSARVALVVAALALLAGTPAVLTAARIRTPWVLASSTAVAAVVVALGAVWRDRYQRQARLRDEQAMGIQDGCLMINGRLPKVAQVRDPLHLG